MIDKIIFGDNQFFGINHMSEEKARDLAEKFSDIKAITNVIDIAYSCGIKAFMLNSNERANEICDYIRQNISNYADLSLYPSIPYAHKYANLVAEKGILGAIRDVILSGNVAKNVASLLTKGGYSFFERDMIKVMQLLIDIEMNIYRNLNVKVIFLQNIVTDLVLGAGLKEIFLAYYSYIIERYSAEPGFVTMNMPRLVDFLLDCGIENPIVCFSINKVGFNMNPDILSYERTIKEKSFRPIAMSIFASGAIKPIEAIRYVCHQPNIVSIVFGASSRQHIEETKHLIETEWLKH